MKQNLSGGSLDLLTAGELGKALHQHMGDDAMGRRIREWYRGVKITKLPVISTAATATSLTLYDPGVPCGPEQGFIWQVRRVLVHSSLGHTDTALVALYAGSDASAGPNALLDDLGVTLNKAYYPANKAAWLFGGEQIYAVITGATVGAVYTLNGIAIEVPWEMQAKLAAG